MDRPDPPSAHDVGRRAVAGAATLILRSFLLKVLTFAGWLVLARLLGPSGFGSLAFGLTVMMGAAVLVDGGLGAGLIRQEHDPEPADLRAVAGVQLVLATVIALICAAVGFAFGGTGTVTAVVVLGLPLLALKTPGIVWTERHLRYGPVLVVDVVETAVFLGLGVTAAVVGWGPLGVAAAAALRSLAGVSVLYALVPEGRVAPSRDLQRMRGLLGFGAQFQAVAVVGLIRDQALNAGLAGLGGLTALGHWNLASRVTQIPFMIFQSLWRVSYPAMSRLREGGTDLGPVIRVVAARAALMTAVVIAPVLGATLYAVPVVLGPDWREAAQIIPFSLVALLVSGPVSVAAAGYLYAQGHARTVLASATVATVVWLGVSLPLIPFMGALAVGVGWGAAAVCEALYFIAALRRLAGVGVFATVARPAACAAVAGAAGLLAGQQAGEGGVGTLAALAVSTAVLAAAAAIFLRQEVREAAGTVNQFLRGRRPAPAPIIEKAVV